MKKKTAYDPGTTLHPMALQQEVEDLARRLYELACCGSRVHWGQLTSSDQIKTDPSFRRNFLESAHKGMWAAQTEVVNHIRSSNKLTLSQELLFRGIADSMAWQLIGLQLCYARRLFREHRQPDLRHCNFDSVVSAAEHLVTGEPGSMALISDLTSFIQIGDLLTMGPAGGLGIVEVKEGEKNKAITDFMNFYLQNGCERALDNFAQREGPKSVEQLGRILRQVGRLSHVTEVMSKGRSIDPDTEENIVIPEDFVFIDTWGKELNQALEEAATKGWAINVIDECLFVGCYSHGALRAPGHVVFNFWFDGCGGTPNCPRVRLLDAMQMPLALPVFNLDISDEHKFDILFGRKQVCLGINVQSLLTQCEKAGLHVRVASNKEATKLDQTGRHPYRHNGKAVFIGDGKSDFALMDGVFMRILFHAQRPLHLIKALFGNDRQTIGKSK